MNKPNKVLMFVMIFVGCMALVSIGKVCAVLIASGKMGSSPITLFNVVLSVVVSGVLVFRK